MNAFVPEVVPSVMFEDENPTGDPDGIHGGLFATEGELPSYAVFSVIVEDVAATCRRAEEAGGKVQRAPQANPDGLRGPTAGRARRRWRRQPEDAADVGEGEDQ